MWHWLCARFNQYCLIMGWLRHRFWSFSLINDNGGELVSGLDGDDVGEGDNIELWDIKNTKVIILVIGLVEDDINIKSWKNN